MCGCTKRTRQKFVWTSADGETTQEYDTAIQAQAKVLRVGGKYEAKAPASTPA